MGRALFAVALSLVLAGLGHVFLGLWRGLWFAIPSSFLLFIYMSGMWDQDLAMAFFLSLGIFAAFDAFSIARRGHGIV
jgi:hypothetical protein